MQREVFSAGVTPGSPSTQSEIKTLICHMLAGLNTDISFELIHEALREYGLVNYFELITSLSQLCATGHLALDRDENSGVERYRITTLGQDAARELSSALPVAAREKAAVSARRALGRQRRLSEVKVSTREENGGYILTMSLPDTESNLISFEVFAPNKQECIRLRRRFLNDPIFIYQSVMELLAGKKNVLGEPSPVEEELF